MKAELKVNDKIVEIELTREQLEMLGIEEFKKTGWERAKKGLEFYYMHAGLEIYKTKECGYQADNEREKCGNYFTDENLAKKMAKRVSLMLRMQRWADEHNDPYFANGYYSIVYDSVTKSLYSFINFTRTSPLEVYFTSIEVLEDAIEIFGDEIKEVMSLD